VSPERPCNGGSRLETGISYLLLAGVIISLLLEVVGLMVYCYSHGSLAVSREAAMYFHGQDFFTFIFQQLAGKNSSSAAVKLMTAGIIALILTPYIRLLASVVYFIWEKNVKFVFITFFVLVVVTLSFALH